MKIVQPVEVTPTRLTSTNVTNDYADWTAGTYNEGDRRVHERQAWEALKTTNEEPSVDVPEDWLRLGFSNQWRMFTEGRDSVTTEEGGIEVEIVFDSLVTTLAVLGVAGSEVRLVAVDATDGTVYDQTISLVDIGVTSHWEWHFLPYDVNRSAVFEGIPPYSDATFTLYVNTATPTGIAQAGRVVAGVARDIGVTNYGTSVNLLSYSTKDRDGFGDLTLIKRRTIRLIDFDVRVSTRQIEAILNQLESIDGIPTLFVGESDRRSTVAFGVYRDVVQGIDYPTVSELTIQVEEF